MGDVLHGQEAALKEQPTGLTGSDLVESLRSSYSQSVDDAMFYCEYRLKSGFVRSADDIFDIGKVAGTSINDGLTGVYAKKGDWWRYSKITKGYNEREVVKSTESGNGVDFNLMEGSQHKSDDIKSDSIYLQRISVPEKNAKHGRVQLLAELEPDQDGVVRPGNFSMWSPLEPLRRPLGGMPGEFWPLPPAHAYQVTTSQDGKCILSTENPEAKKSYKAVWNTTQSPPLLESVSISTVNDMGATEVTAVTMQDFRDCSGTHIPAHVVLQIGKEFRNARGGKTDLILVQHWISDDLGARAPVDADFELHFSADVPVVGYRGKEGAEAAVTLSPASILPADLLSPQDANIHSPAIAAPANQPKMGQGVWWGTILLNVIFALCILVFLKRRQP